MSRLAVRIAFFYAFFGVLTVLAGDRGLAVLLAGRSLSPSLYSTLAITYILVGSGLILAVARRALHRQRLAEAELRHSDERWHFALAGVGDGVWDWNATNDELFLSPRYKEMLGYAENELPSVIGSWEAILHPDDREHSLRSIADHLGGATAFHYAEFRLRCSDNSWKWILGRGRVVARDETGNALRIVGTHTDITTLKQAQQALQASEEQMRQQFETLPTAMLVIDAASARLLDANPAALAMLGYDAATLLALTLADISPDTDPTLPLRACAVTFEARYRRRDGSVLHGDVCSAPQYDASGAVIRLVFGIIDVTERKAAHDAAAVSDRRFRDLFRNMLDGVAHCRIVYLYGTAVDFEFIGVNASFLRLTGLDDVVGRRAGELTGGLRESFLKLFAECGRTEGHVPSQKREIFVDGLERWYSTAMYSPAAGEFMVIFEDITLRKEAEERIDFLAFHDPLTGLPNRRRVRERIERSLMQAHHDNQSVAVFFIDFDHFKSINDSLGHAVGDTFLQAATHRLLACRGDGDMLARLGGDEFLLVIVGVMDRVVLAGRADALIAQMAEPFLFDRHELSLSASIGIAVSPNDGTDYDTLLSRADAAMFRAKESGRNGWRFFDATMSAGADTFLSLYAGLHRALDRDEFAIDYQPQVDLDSGRIVGAEALLRWNSPERGLLSPDRFIGVAEASGLIVPIGTWILNEVCRQAVTWRKSGLSDLVVAVNLSAVQFRRGDLEKTVLDALSSSGLAPEALELELTESTLVDDTENCLLTMTRLRNIGVRLSIDDFGTGYSSFMYLRRFVIDKLKIDQSFVTSMRTSPNDAAIAHAIINMARIMGVRTIAEGVEDEAIAELLRGFRCDEAQGFLYGRPMSATAFAHHCLAARRLHT